MTVPSTPPRSTPPYVPAPARTAALLFAALTLVASGCGLAGSVQLPERRMTTFDFTPFLDRGFLFTPTLYEGPHETLGLVVLTFRPGTAEAVRRVTEARTDGWATSDARVAPLLDRMYEAARGLGGDGVMELTVETTSDNAGAVTYHLSGYAIRRGEEAPGGRSGIE